jgi:hypothetical protein
MQLFYANVLAAAAFASQLSCHGRRCVVVRGMKDQVTRPSLLSLQYSCNFKSYLSELEVSEQWINLIARSEAKKTRQAISE